MKNTVLRILSLSLFLLMVQSGTSQELRGLLSTYDDSFREWLIYYLEEPEILTDSTAMEVALDEEEELEELEGELRMRWINQDDWTTWDFRMGETTGHIQQVFPKDPSQWEVRVNNTTTTARTLWRQNPLEWRITNNSTTMTLRSRYSNNVNEWIMHDEKYGRLYIYTYYRDDPREWVIVDELSPDIPLGMKLTAVFLAAFNSSPRI